MLAASGFITYFCLLSDSPVPFCLALGLTGFGSAGTSIIINIMLSDAIDYDELHTGKRRESTYHVSLPFGVLVCG
jgi:Na+/melibiose symporter-like transporter